MKRTNHLRSFGAVALGMIGILGVTACGQSSASDSSLKEAAWHAQENAQAANENAQAALDLARSAQTASERSAASAQEATASLREVSSVTAPTTGYLFTPQPGDFDEVTSDTANAGNDGYWQEKTNKGDYDMEMSEVGRDSVRIGVGQQGGVSIAGTSVGREPVMTSRFIYTVGPGGSIVPNEVPHPTGQYRDISVPR